MAPKRVMEKNGEQNGKKAGKRGLKLKARLNRYATRPKRPAAAYALFLKDKYKGKKLKGKQVLAATKAWRKLTQAKKDKYIKRAAATLRDHKKAMEDWQTKKQFLKQPPYSYGLFVRDFWKDEGHNYPMLGFVGMSKRCAKVWNKLSNIYKTEYKNMAGRLASDFQDCLQALDRGANIDTLIRNWGSADEAMGRAFAMVEELAGFPDEMDYDEDISDEESENDDEEEESDEISDDEEEDTDENY